MIKELTDPSNNYNIPRQEKVFFQILKRDSKEIPVLSQQEERIGEQLERQRQNKILERIEFEKQTELFNQKELIKALQRKEILKANQNAWV